MNNNKREEIIDITKLDEIESRYFARLRFYPEDCDSSWVIDMKNLINHVRREVTKQQEPELTPYQRSALGRENSYKPNKVSCPYCNSKIDLNFIEYHVESCKPTNPTEPEKEREPVYCQCGFQLGYKDKNLGEVRFAVLHQCNKEPTTKETMEPKGSKLMTYDDTWALIDERSAKHLEDLMRDGYIQRTPKQPEQSQLEVLEKWMYKGFNPSHEEILDKIQELKKGKG